MLLHSKKETAVGNPFRAAASPTILRLLLVFVLIAVLVLILILVVVLVLVLILVAVLVLVHKKHLLPSR